MRLVAAGLLVGLLFAGLAGCQDVRAQATPEFQQYSIPLNCDDAMVTCEIAWRDLKILQASSAHSAAEIKRLSRELDTLKSACTARLEVIPPAPRPKPKAAPGTVAL